MQRCGPEGRVGDLDGRESLGRQIDLELDHTDAEHAVGLERRCERRKRKFDRGSEQERTGAEASDAVNGVECKADAR
eukprot:5183156-Pleurochrysis_carterae.AAC.1